MLKYISFSCWFSNDKQSSSQRNRITECMINKSVAKYVDLGSDDPP